MKWILVVLSLTIAACNQPTTPTPPPAAPVPKATTPAPAPTVEKPPEVVSYTSIKNVLIDGESAIGKRARLTCDYQGIQLGKILCTGSRAEAIWATFDESLKEKLKALREGRKAILDLWIKSTIGPSGVALDIGPMKH